MALSRAYRQGAGFTLIELMVVVAIVAIIAAIAYPSYQSQVQASRRADGKSMLMQVMQAEERYYTENYKYTTDLVGDLGLDGKGASGNNVLSDDEHYEISAAACGGGGIDECVVLTATAQGPQAGDVCGNLTLDSRGNKTPQNPDECW
ncbi:hypothetical protein KBTX_03557 [wastewater metagenome]|uniref:Fimbrial protein n=2 Tax=unclassified sequences TaxID=12908 RepID=A0A5B8RDV0_9ZZZZ|nr:type IV pilin protein [Arhodomonas sp. KWT]QEA07209.1 hypothetical protein KBTEX_03557 [uncultured organism]